MESTYTTYDASLSASDDGTAVAAAIMTLIFIWLFVFLVVAVPSIIGLWKLFKKAGQPGWAAIVPVYNIIVWCKIVGRPTWWVLLFFVPVVQLVANLALNIDLAKSFGKDTVFGVLTWLFAPVMLLVLAFSKDTTYVGPVAEGTDMFSSFTSHTSSSAPQHPAPAAPANPFATTTAPEASAETPAATTPTTPVATPAPIVATPAQPTAPAPEAPVVNPDQNKTA